MTNYFDSEGAMVEAYRLTGQSILGTATGEQVGEEGQWVVVSKGLKPFILDDAEFVASFTPEQ
jgi:hypothetical protein